MNVLLCVLATLSLALTTTGAFSQSPDTVLLNSTIVTADERNTIHQALAVHDGRIVALGKLLTDAARRAGRIGEARTLLAEVTASRPAGAPLPRFYRSA